MSVPQEYQTGINQNPELARRQLNSILALLYSGQAGYGASLPAAAVDGALYTDTGANKLYQYQSGAWVALT